MKTPRSMDLCITDSCNLRCKYCSHFTSAGNVGSDLPTEEWLKFFEELSRCAVMDVTFSGGEPFSRADLGELIAGIVRNRMRFAILTNGTMVDDDKASMVAKSGRCSSVQVSIDSSIPATHDSFRGKGSFFKAIRGLRCLQQHGVPVTVRVTIHRKNVRDLEGVAELLLEDVKLPSFSTNCAEYMGLCRQNMDEVQLTTEEHSLAMETLLRLSKRYRGRISAAAGPLADGRNWCMMEETRLAGRDRLPGRGVLAACGGVMSKIAVRADGVFVPCTQMPHVELGRINRDRLEDVWQRHPELVKLRERRKIPLRELEFCRGCEYVEYCTGGCPATAYTIAGDYNHPSPDTCLRRFLAEGGRLPFGEFRHAS
jgi:SynChlorMet cassette radical SAM/SPASM protein ScmE